MRGAEKGIIFMAAAGIILLGGLTAGLFAEGKGARAGREYIENVMGTSGGTAGSGDIRGLPEEISGISQQTGTENEMPYEPENQIEIETAEENREAWDSEKALEQAPSEIVMLFAGDVYFSSHVLNAYDKAGGIQGVLDQEIRSEIQKADIFMVNQEFPFTERGTAAADKQFTFRVPESRMHLMQEMGIDIVTLANNHILDFGTEGLLDSCSALDKAGILYVGAGEDLERASALQTVVIGDKKIGFLGTSRVYMDASWAAGNSHPGVFSTYDVTLPLKVIEEAKQNCDYLVVYVHWGVEKETAPKDYQQAMGRAYIDAGADLVVGSHPHVLQETEEYKGKTIVYSLGNFVFGSSILETALLKVVWEQDNTTVSMIPCTSSGGYTHTALSP